MRMVTQRRYVSRCTDFQCPPSQRIARRFAVSVNGISRKTESVPNTRKL